MVVSNALVTLITAPLRRLRFLLTAEDDLIEEGILPPERGFGGVLGCAKFLYAAGGSSLAVFYRCAFAEAGLCVVKYGMQRLLMIPILRHLPLQMSHSYLTTTLVHTALMYITLAPLQVAADVVVVNCVADVVPVDTPEAVTPARTPKPSGSDENCNKQPSQPQRYRLRFSGFCEAAAYLWHTLPVRSVVARLFLLEFSCRYVSSLVNNKLLGYVTSAVHRHSQLDHSVGPTASQHFLLYIASPLLVSSAVGLLTYPLTTFPFVHFVRVRYYERQGMLTSADTLQSSDVADDYPPVRSRSMSRGRKSASRDRADGQVTDVEGFWWEDMLRVVFHWEVRNYLWTVAHRPRTAPPPPTTVENQDLASSTEAHCARLYRGYGLMIISTIVSVALSKSINSLVSFGSQVLQHRLDGSHSS